MTQFVTIVNVAWHNCFRKIFNACWRESAKPFLYYCNTMSASLLIDQRKILFYKKTVCRQFGDIKQSVFQ